MMSNSNYTGPLLAGVLMWDVAASHVPYIEGEDYGEQGSFSVEKPLQSKAFYGWLDSREDVDVFTVRVDEPLRLYTQTLVPYCEEYRDFGVAWAITGPGLPPAPATLPHPPAPGDGALVATGTSAPPPQRATLHERFTDRDYFVGGELVLEQTAPGEYSIMVWHPGGRIGDYVVVIGELEQFGPADVARAARNTLKVRREAELHGPCTEPAR